MRFKTSSRAKHLTSALIALIIASITFEHAATAYEAGNSISLTSPSRTFIPNYALSGTLRTSGAAPLQLFVRVNDGAYWPLHTGTGSTFHTNVSLPRYGANILTMELRDGGKTVTRVQKTIVLGDNLAPLVNLDANATVRDLGQHLRLSATAVDNRRLTEISIYDGNKLIARSSQSPLNVKIPVRPGNSGDHVFIAAASDGNLRSRSSAIQVRFNGKQSTLGMRLVSPRIVFDEDYALRGTIRAGTLVTATATVGQTPASPMSVTKNQFAAKLPLKAGWNPIVIEGKDAAGAVETREYQVFRVHYAKMSSTAPELLALKPLVADIYASYGLNENSPPLERTAALRDWVARNMVHPDIRLHLNGTSANVGVLPDGDSWESVNAVLTADKVATDQKFWDSFRFDGYAMLNALLGTLDPATGKRKNDGMMEQVAPGHFRIKNIQTFKYPYCTYQASVLVVLWAAAGFDSMGLSTNGHDPAAVFIPGAGWIYSDPTFNEEVRVVGTRQPLDMPSLIKVVDNGDRSKVRPLKGIGRGKVGPLWDNEQYISADVTYLKFISDGYRYFRPLTDNSLLGGTDGRMQVTVSGSKDPTPCPVVPVNIAFSDDLP
jgi:hypothetical protein